jgi:hypothetical protein
MPGTSYRDYIMALPRPMAPAEYFVADENAPITALPPILVTVTEEFDLRKSSKPIVRWDDVPTGSMDSALEAILRQACELRAKGIEPVFTLNGKVVDLAGPIDPHNL